MVKSINKFCKFIINQNTAICGLRGTGKDLLMAQVASRYDYISNFDYKTNKHYYHLEPTLLDVNNDYSNLINDKPNKYIYPYQEGLPILVSDASLYFPASYESDLKKRYKGIVNFMPLSRHLANTNIIVNSQYWSQVWDKIRNQCDTYILCLKSIYIKPFNLVIQKVRVYDKQQSFLDRVPPLKFKLSLFSKNKDFAKIENLKYQISYGSIKSYTLIYFNRSKYDTRYFKDLFCNA